MLLRHSWEILPMSWKYWPSIPNKNLSRRTKQDILWILVTEATGVYEIAQEEGEIKKRQPRTKSGKTAMLREWTEAAWWWGWGLLVGEGGRAWWEPSPKPARGDGSAHLCWRRLTEQSAVCEPRPLALWKLVLLVPLEMSEPAVEWGRTRRDDTEKWVGSEGNQLVYKAVSFGKFSYD